MEHREWLGVHGWEFTGRQNGLVSAAQSRQKGESLTESFEKELVFLRLAEWG